MRISINDNRKIEQLQEEFSSNFPYLKLQFFSRSHEPGQPSPPKQLRPADRTIGECRTRHKNGHIVINPQMTVAELEQKFRDYYGLNVQIFRKSGSVWLETTVTDGWSLEKQNSQGESLSRLSYVRTRDKTEEN